MTDGGHDVFSVMFGTTSGYGEDEAYVETDPRNIVSLSTVVHLFANVVFKPTAIY